MTEGDPAFGQIVGGKFERDFVARKHPDSVAAQPACEMREHYPFVFQLNAEKTAGKLFQHGPGDFYTVFLTHSTSSILSPRGRGRTRFTGSRPMRCRFIPRKSYDQNV